MNKCANCAELERQLQEAKQEIGILDGTHKFMQDTLADLTKQLIERQRADWRKVVATEVFQDMKNGRYRDILTLLQCQEISVGKAVEAICERAAGIEPTLPKL